MTEHLKEYQFAPGQEKTPGSGRKLGVRNKLSERFLKDLHDEWERSGEATLKILAKENPEAFARLAVGILPKEFEGLPPPVTIVTGVWRGDEIGPIAPPSFRAPPGLIDCPVDHSLEQGAFIDLSFAEYAHLRCQSRTIRNGVLWSMPLPTRESCALCAGRSPLLTLPERP
jgi:hypothetical protein